jgi:predicted metal-binding membrane protein
VAAAYQISPLKVVCLRHCRTPMSFFMRQRHNLQRPLGATLAGATHGLVCFACCWALMLILVALGTMQLTWMIILAALIYVEKVSRRGELVARWTAVAFGGLGLSLLLNPALLSRLP